MTIQVVLALPDLEPDLRPTEESEVISVEDRSESRFGLMKEDEGRKGGAFLAFRHQMKWSVRFQITDPDMDSDRNRSLLPFPHVESRSFLARPHSLARSGKITHLLWVSGTMNEAS